MVVGVNMYRVRARGIKDFICKGLFGKTDFPALFGLINIEPRGVRSPRDKNIRQAVVIAIKTGRTPADIVFKIAVIDVGYSARLRLFGELGNIASDGGVCKKESCKNPRKK